MVKTKIHYKACWRYTMSFECLVGEKRTDIGGNGVHSAGGNDNCTGLCSQVIESRTHVNDTLAGEEEGVRTQRLCP